MVAGNRRTGVLGICCMWEEDNAGAVGSSPVATAWKDCGERDVVRGGASPAVGVALVVRGCQNTTLSGPDARAGVRRREPMLRTHSARVAEVRSSPIQAPGARRPELSQPAHFP
jgi:hypothetical protein